MDKAIRHICVLTMAFIVTACSLIDEDLDRCGSVVTVEYTLIVSPQPPVEVASKLVTPEEVRLGDVLRRQYGTFFEPYSDSLEVSLCCGDLPIVYRNCIYGSCCTRTYYLPKGVYSHEAYAGDYAADTTIVIDNRSVSEWIFLRHTHGVAALVFDGISPNVTDVRVQMAGSNTEKQSGATTLNSYSAKLYPRAADWQASVFATLSDGTVTKTTLTIRRPIIAGEMVIEKAVLDDMGVVCFTTDEMGASVELDWKDGSEYTPQL